MTIESLSIREVGVRLSCIGGSVVPVILSAMHGIFLVKHTILQLSTRSWLNLRDLQALY